MQFDGERTEHKVIVAIYDNSIREESKTFSVQLKLLSGVRTRLMPSSMTITITEDDIDDQKPGKHMYIATEYENTVHPVSKMIFPT